MLSGGARAVILFTASVVCAAPADHDQEIAKQHYAAGQRLYGEGKYAEALDEYQIAFRLTHYPGVLYRVALCQERLGRSADAIASFEHYLEVEPNSPRRSSVTERIAALKAKASTSEEAARQYFVEGKRHYNLREFEEALAAFKHAYMGHDDPRLFYNIARCLEELRSTNEALEMYRRYLVELTDPIGGSPPRPEEVEEVRRKITDLEVRLDDLRGEQKLLAPATLVVAPAAEPRKPVTRRWWFWTAIGGGAAAVALAVGLGVGLGAASFSPTLADQGPGRASPGVP